MATKQVPCKFGDRCTKKPCAFFHASVCPNLSECPKQNCPYSHPTPCLFGNKCLKRTTCPFYHVPLCPTFPECVKGNFCPYFHPQRCRFDELCTKRDTCPFYHTPVCPKLPQCSGQNCCYIHPERCKFGNRCSRRESCHFYHVPLCPDPGFCNRDSCKFEHVCTNTSASHIFTGSCPFDHQRHPKQRVCRMYKCARTDCTYYHDPSQITCNVGTPEKPCGQNCPYAHTYMRLCPYGARCAKKYFHTQLTPSRDICPYVHGAASVCDKIECTTKYNKNCNM